MASQDTKTSAATELADGNSSAATEHTEEPQLAEIVNQEAGRLVVQACVGSRLIICRLISIKSLEKINPTA